MLDWKDRNVLVLGLGDTGLSMTRWLVRHGARVRVADSRGHPPHKRTLEAESPDVPISTGPFSERDFARADVIAISPGVDRREASIAGATRRGVPVVGDVEMFAGALDDVAARQSRARPQVVAITGSNGKSTVTAMAGEVSRVSGRATIVAGNIGLPVLDALTEIENGKAMPDVFVLELSSFQLESTSSLRADAATVLNVTEDHLDRYDGMDEYADAKARVFAGAGVQVLNRQDAWSMRMARPGKHATTFGLDAPANDHDWGVSGHSMLLRGGDTLMPIDELPVAGLHNAANALAALALCDAIGMPESTMLEGLRRFRGLPHRLEKVAEVRGITFYDDSKGTNVGATVAALNGMTVPVVLIAGGDGKGQNFSPLTRAISTHARAVVLIGRDAPQIEHVLTGSGVRVLHASTLEDAVQAAYSESRTGDAVLLSPACASYDMFTSYVHRAQVFVAAVKALAATEEGRLP
jgi:UDP-N-acetylmuramoylalanine--D-glutamate ligase